MRPTCSAPRVRDQDETPLPEGFHADRERSVWMQIQVERDPLISLTQAIFIQACRDGCNPEWLQLIAQYYGVRLPDKLVDRIRCQETPRGPCKRRIYIHRRHIGTFLSLAGVGILG